MIYTFRLYPQAQTQPQPQPQESFRNVCEQYIGYLRNIKLPEFCDITNAINESVLIEYGCLPHLEFVIRNTIIKLGEKWAHTIICGDANYDFIVRTCSNISNKINIIKKTNDLPIWDLLKGVRILFYKENSIILKNNIHEYMKWDFIGNKDGVCLYTTTKQIAPKADIKSTCIFSTSFSDNNNNINVIRRMCIQYRACTNNCNLEHRGGWKSVLNNLIDKQFYNNKSTYEFYDMMELKFLWNNDVIQNEWSGIVHATPFTPPYLSSINLHVILNNPNFAISLRKCLFIISLSNYVTQVIKKWSDQNNISVRIYTLKHPVVMDNIKQFDYDSYTSNEKKKILQIGQQLRKVSSIYRIEGGEHSKSWLTGTKNITKCMKILKKEIEYYKINITPAQYESVKVYYADTHEEYDDLLSKNIVFIDLFDASANNAVLECIVRNTPILINKIAPVVEYLGEDYPLYFTCLAQVDALINDRGLILKAHEYLKGMDKTMLSIPYFTQQLFNISYEMNWTIS